MTSRKMVCLNGHCTRHAPLLDGTLGAELGGKIALSLLGGALGRASKDPLGAVLGALTGALLGHVLLDRLVIPNCPACGTALRLVNTAL